MIPSRAATIPAAVRTTDRPRVVPAVLPVIGFAFALVSLAAAALFGWLAPRPVVTGFPEDRAWEPARAAMRNEAPRGREGLRHWSSLAGEAPLGASDAAVPDVPRLAGVERELQAAARRHGRDPRPLAALGAISLRLERLEHAERQYRAAVDRSGRYGEARLGLGVALAERAGIEGDPEQARGLRLSALAQVASVDPGDPAYLPALFDRALLLTRVGRVAEARRWARVYASLEPDPRLRARLAASLDAVIGR